MAWPGLAWHGLDLRMGVGWGTLGELLGIGGPVLEGEADTGGHPKQIELVRP